MYLVIMLNIITRVDDETDTKEFITIVNNYSRSK